MKKILFLWIFISSLSACSSDESDSVTNNTPDITGVWKQVQVQYTENGDWQELDCERRGILTFNPDDTFMYDTECYNPDEPDPVLGNYSVQDNTLTTIANDVTASSIITPINATEIYMQEMASGTITYYPVYKLVKQQ